MGVFDPGVAGMDTTASVTSANTSAPVVTVTGEAAGDVNMYFFLKAGTNSIPGWYPITAVDTSAHTYTLNATVGAVVLTNYTRNTAVGCASSGTTLSSVTWAVDFSQTTGNITTGTASSAATTLTATTGIFRKPMIGNGATNGTNWVVITAFTSSTVVTIDSSPTWVAQSISIGGALASPGKAGSLMVAGNDLFIKSGSNYTVTSASSNVAGGCLTLPASASNSNVVWCMGYQTVRGDNGTKPIIKSDGVITTFTLITTASTANVINVEVDGNSRTSSRGVNVVGNSYVRLCTGRNCTNSAFNGAATSFAERCYATTCSTVSAFNGISSIGCVADGNSITGFTLVGGFCSFCISSNNSGGSSDGFVQGGENYFTNCTAYTNGRDGLRGLNTTVAMVCLNSISYNNSGSQFNAAAAVDNVSLINCACVSGGVNANITNRYSSTMVTIAADPFTNAAGGDFSLNNAATGGALCRNSGIPGAMPGLASTTGFLSLGAVQPKVYLLPLIGNEELIAV